MLARLQKDKKATSSVSVNELPPEILLLIFSFLKPEQRLIAGMACSSWYNISTDTHFERDNNIAKQFQLFKRKCIRETQNSVQKQTLMIQYENVLSSQTKMKIALMGTEANKILFLPDSNAYSSLANLNIAAGGIKIGYAGGKKMQLQSVPSLMKFATTLSIYLKDTNILIFSFNKEKDKNSQLTELDSTLKKYNNNCIVIIINGDINAGKYLSVELLKEDTFQSFYGRLAQVINEARNSLISEAETSEKEEEDLDKGQKRCLIS